jgi:hypothetical protein
MSSQARSGQALSSSSSEEKIDNNIHQLHPHQNQTGTASGFSDAYASAPLRTPTRDRAKEASPSQRYYKKPANDIGVVFDRDIIPTDQNMPRRQAMLLIIATAIIGVFMGMFVASQSGSDIASDVQLAAPDISGAINGSELALQSDDFDGQPELEGSSPIIGGRDMTEFTVRPFEPLLQRNNDQASAQAPNSDQISQTPNVVDNESVVPNVSDLDSVSVQYQGGFLQGNLQGNQSAVTDTLTRDDVQDVAPPVGDNALGDNTRIVGDDVSFVLKRLDDPNGLLPNDAIVHNEGAQNNDGVQPSSQAATADAIDAPLLDISEDVIGPDAMAAADRNIDDGVRLVAQNYDDGVFAPSGLDADQNIDVQKRAGLSALQNINADLTNDDLVNVEDVALPVTDQPLNVISKSADSVNAGSSGDAGQGVSSQADNGNNTLVSLQFSADQLSLIQGYIERGTEFLARGDVVTARSFFSLAMREEHPDGYEFMGKSYDPDVLSLMSVFGVSGDRDKAQSFYAQAEEKRQLMAR